MCGIVSVVVSQDSPLKKSNAEQLFCFLMTLSQSRGQDSSGLAGIVADKIKVYKASIKAENMLHHSEAKEILQSRILVGHSRMETDGSFKEANNNQPVVKENSLVVHNGIIVNASRLYDSDSSLKRVSEVDTEIIADFANRALDTTQPMSSLYNNLQKTEGTYNTITLWRNNDAMFVATNNGSLYFAVSKTLGLFVVASEKRFLVEANTKYMLNLDIQHLEAGSGFLFCPKTFEFEKFELNNIGDKQNEFLKSRKRDALAFDISSRDPFEDPEKYTKIATFNDQYKKLEKLVLEGYRRVKPYVDKLKRCSRCIRPETIPFIEFDSSGVCNFCHIHKPNPAHGTEKLLKYLEPYRRPGKQLEAIVAFSGGRDSSYALHYAVKELGLKVVAYSYDWGMLTDLGRRNQSRMTAALGVEHILVSADIKKKRRNIRLNVEAWLKQPDLGMVPIFMAGDKQYFYYLGKLREQMGIDLQVYSDHPMETTYFKYGFAGVNHVPQKDSKKDWAMGLSGKIKLFSYYGSRYLTNPKYINYSLLDTLGAFLSYYAISKDYLYLFRFLQWNEREIEKTLLGKYNWELSPDTKSTWRIGDGTAAFYNYIYYVLGGLTEHDTFRSNQINGGFISRSEGLVLAEEMNFPRTDSIMWYCNTIGIDPVEAIKRINAAPSFIRHFESKSNERSQTW